MAGEWPLTPLGEVSINHDKLRIPVKEADRKPGPYAYYGASGVIDRVDQYLFEGDYLLVAEDGENLRTRQTPVAFMAAGRFWVNNHAHILTGNSRALTRYLHYMLAAADIEPFLTGAVMPKLTQLNLSRIPIPLASLPEQRAVVETLGSLDDKIDLNRRKADTLETIARALFTSWFIDFDPVQAKVENRETELPADLAGLFPDRLDDDGRPNGWSKKRLGDILELAYGKSLTAGNRKPGKVPVYGSNGQVGEHDTALVDRPGIVVGRKGYPGVVTYVSKPFFPIDTTFYVVPRSAAAASYLWLLLENASLAGLAADSAVPGLNRETAYAVETVEPSEETIAAFDRIAAPLIERAAAAREECEQLAELRDILLPKLISGDLRIKDAERVVGEAA